MKAKALFTIISILFIQYSCSESAKEKSNTNTTKDLPPFKEDHWVGGDLFDVFFKDSSVVIMYTPTCAVEFPSTKINNNVVVLYGTNNFDCLLWDSTEIEERFPMDEEFAYFIIEDESTIAIHYINRTYVYETVGNSKQDFYPGTLQRKE